MRGRVSGQSSQARRARRGPPARLVLAHLLIGSLAVAAPSRQEVDRCAEAFEQGQVQRKDGHLLAARASFEGCARPVCPGAVSKMCARWLDEVRGQVPRLRVSGPAGTIVVDGQPSGAAPATIEVDPGPHRIALRTERGDGPPVTVEARASSGPTPVELAAPAPPASAPAPASASASAPPVPGRSGHHTAGYVTLGLGLVAVGAGAWVGLAARSEANDRRDRCAQGDCSTEQDRDRLRARLGLADALMGVGAVASGVGLYLLLRPGTSVTVASRPGGAAASATFAF